ncbi:MAG: sigma-54-dependent Fis family transcriptional regulator [Phycisphaerae bacterium]|nr:sigma-54-dependent Fis family transcriptional regulator [Gemmatimonadaceae bacterium]
MVRELRANERRRDGSPGTLAKNTARLSVAILLTDVEPAVRLNAALEQAGFETVTISPMDDVRGTLRRTNPALLVLTGALLDPTNLSLVRQQLWAGVPVLGFTDVSDSAMQERLLEAGYAETWPKPIVIDEVVAAVRRRLERRELADATGLVGESEAIREMLVKVEQIAPVSSTVLIEGESGTGKELVARAIHRLSPRRANPFIAVNVGALPETLLESELFGHEKGAFTGAAERRLGRFELADTGTLFLDEIGEIPPATQVKLLRVLEEREVTRVGGSAAIPLNVRVVAASNRPLREHVEEGGFRADLFYRLNVLRIYLPPLRERKSDIPLLVRKFIAEFSRAHDRPFVGLSAEALESLVEYPWPGNVRELRNLIESMVVLAHGAEIEANDIPPTIRDRAMRRLPVPLGPVVRESARAEGRELEFIVRSLVELKMQVEELRRRLDVEVRDNRGVPSTWVGEVHAVPSAPDLTEVGRGVQSINSYVGGIEAPESELSVRNTQLQPGMTMAEIERQAILGALRDTGGNRRKAAELLGIGERTLYRKIRGYEAESGITYASDIDDPG